MPVYLTKEDPGTAQPIMIDGLVFSILPSEIDMTPEPISQFLDTLGGGAREYQRRPGFDGVADHADRYTFAIPYEGLKGSNRVNMELIRVRGGVHRITVWRMVPVVYTLKSGVQRIYLPRYRKIAAHLYDGVNLGGVIVNTTSFPTLAELNDDPLSVTYATGPTLVSPGAGGIVIARQPDASGAAMDYTAMLLGDTVETGDKLSLWAAFTFECSMRAPRIIMRRQQESHAHTFVEV